jgi:hypothetical protein
VLFLVLSSALLQVLLGYTLPCVLADRGVNPVSLADLMETHVTELSPLLLLLLLLSILLYRVVGGC